MAVFAGAFAGRAVEPCGIKGGRVMVNGNRRPIGKLADLPAGEIRITGVDLTGTLLDPKELSNIAGLTEVRELFLPGVSIYAGVGQPPGWQRRAEGAGGTVGDFDSDVMRSALDSYLTACLKNKKAAGFHLVNPERDRPTSLINQEFTFIPLSMDTASVMYVAKLMLEVVRDAAGKTR
jgi:hypothetical protein